MHENENKKSSNKEIWGCVGIVGAAFITGLFGLIVALPNLIPLFRPTPAPTMVTIPEIFTSTAIIELAQGTPTALPVVQIQPTSTTFVYAPLSSEYISVKGYVGIVNSGGIPGNMKYSHLVTGKIKYELVEADDDIGQVELVCADGQTKDITSSFFLISQPEDSIFPNYASNEIEVPTNCRVDFSVIDMVGGQTGITIRAITAP